MNRDLLAVPNPFERSVVHDAWQAPDADVPSIHDRAFEQCLRSLDSVSRGKSDSVIVHGASGSGKTHLLARLQRHLSATARDAPDSVLRCVFVSVKLQTNAQLLWQFVRRRLATDLLRRQEGVTQLQRLLAHQLAALRSETPRQWVRALRVLTREGDSVSDDLTQIAMRLELSRDLTTVLDHLVHNRFAMDAAAWLRGESLPESILDRLGVAPEEEENREEAARRVVTDLCRLAGETLPIVFCFDQIEAIQTYPDDRDALFRFGRVAADLAEADDNVLLISCIQSAYLDLLKSSVRGSDQDRVFRHHTSLDPLTAEQVRALVKSRLDAIEPLRARRDEGEPWFPFDEAFIAQLARVSPCVPRKVIAAASARFEALQTGRDGARRDVARFLASEFGERRALSLSTGKPEHSETTLMHGLPMLWSLRGIGSSTDGARARGSTKRRAEGTELALKAQDGSPLTLAVCNETHMTSLARKLSRLVARAEQTPPGEATILLRDARLGISRTAKKTQEYLRDLEQRGVPLVEPNAEALSALEALRSLLSDARAGDLADEGETLDETTVLGWLAANLDSELVALCDALASRAAVDRGAQGAATARDAQLVRDLADALLRACVAPLHQLAEELHARPDDLLGVARAHGDRFGVLQGPPAVLFAFVPSEALARAEGRS